MSGLTLGIGRSFRRSSTSSAPSNTGVPASIAIQPGSVTLASVGSTQQFTAVASDINSVVMTGVTFEWYSTDTRYVTINTDSGLATRVQAGGSPKIYARYELLPAWTTRATLGQTELAAGNTGVFATNGTIVDAAETGGAFAAGQKLVRLDYDRPDTENERHTDDVLDGSGNLVTPGVIPYNPRQWFNDDRNKNLETARNSIVCGVDEELLITWEFALDSDTTFDSRLGMKWDYPRTGDGDNPANVPSTFSIVGGIGASVQMFTQYDGPSGIIADGVNVTGGYTPPLVTATTFAHLHRFDSDWGQGNGRRELSINGVSQVRSRTVRFSDPSAEYSSAGDIMARVFNILSIGDQYGGSAPYHRREWIHSITISTRRYR